MRIDSENFLFDRLKDYSVKMPHLLFRLSKGLF